MAFSAPLTNDVSFGVIAPTRASTMRTFLQRQYSKTTQQRYAKISLFLFRVIMDALLMATAITVTFLPRLILTARFRLTGVSMHPAFAQIRTDTTGEHRLVPK
jgi:hypothetical protein